jgi:hypothetical protein
VPQQDTSAFQRWRTPRWYPVVAAPVLGALILADLGLIYVWLHEGSRRGGLPLLIAIDTVVALFLLLRLGYALMSRAPSSSGSDLDGSDGRSNNRWSGP